MKPGKRWQGIQPATTPAAEFDKNAMPPEAAYIFSVRNGLGNLTAIHIDDVERMEALAPRKELTAQEEYRQAMGMVKKKEQKEIQAAGKIIAPMVKVFLRNGSVVKATQEEAKVIFQRLSQRSQTETVNLSEPTPVAPISKPSIKKPWEMNRGEYYRYKTSQFDNMVPLPSSDGGFVYLPRVYVRFGRPPQSGKSKNWLTKKDESGVSTYTAWKDPKTGKYVITTEGVEGGTLGELSAVEGKGVYEITGDFVDEGFDGEPLLKNVKIVNQLSPDDIVISDVPGITISGNNLDTAPDWESAGKKQSNYLIEHENIVKNAIVKVRIYLKI